jgi:hypothetical protein
VKRWSKSNRSAVPDAPDMELNRGVVSDAVLSAYEKASAKLTSMRIPHLVVGGLAVGAWGHPRATKDIDFLVREKDVFDGKLFLSFKKNVPIQVEGVAVDYLVVESLPTKTRFKIANEKVVPIEILFAMKLKARRAQDDADIIALVHKGADVREIYGWLQAEGFADEIARLAKLVERAQEERERE